jgi:membrane-associated protease RseP (regulator of RpoE activity)
VGSDEGARVDLEQGYLMEFIGIVVFALGILISVCLHEAGHMITAKAFKMKVTRYFVGFGPTLWSFRKGETEYGVKALPLGGFVKIVGMTPQDDDVAPGDEPRAMWRQPVWKRTVVMAAGSATHFALGFVILWGLFAFVPHQDPAKTNASPPVVDTVLPCVQLNWSIDSGTGAPTACVEGKDPASAAATLGLRPGDKILAVNGEAVPSWTAMTEKIRAAGGQSVTLTFVRDGQTITSGPVTVPSAQRPKLSVDPNTPVNQITQDQLERVGQLGITQVAATTTSGPIDAIGVAKDQTGAMFSATFASIQKFPEKVPKLWDAITGQKRDPETPVSVVGASRLGGELFQHGEFPTFVLILAGLNFFVGIFNLLPLLPLDGGHIAIAWFEKVRTWLYARLGRPDPGRVDYLKLMPITYAVILIFGGFTLLTVTADIVNPITLF